MKINKDYSQALSAENEIGSCCVPVEEEAVHDYMKMKALDTSLRYVGAFPLDTELSSVTAEGGS